MKAKLLILTILFFCGCDRRASDAWESVQSSLDTVNKQIAPVADSVTSMTSEQLSNVIKFEYRVVRFPADYSPAQIEAGLNEIGKDRWECFSAVTNEAGTTLYCKRIPYALLRYFLKVM